MDIQDPTKLPLNIARSAGEGSFAGMSVLDKVKLFRAAAKEFYGDNHRANQFFLSAARTPSQRVGRDLYAVPSNLREMVARPDYANGVIASWIARKADVYV